MKFAGYFQLGGEGSVTFTGTNAEVVVADSERNVCNSRDKFFSGTIANLASIPIRVMLHPPDQEGPIHKHDLRPREVLRITMTPLFKVGFALNGTALVHMMGTIWQAETPFEYMTMAQSSKLEEYIADAPHQWNEYTHTDIAAATTTDIFDPGANEDAYVYKITLAVQGANRLELRWRTQASALIEILGTVNFAGEGTFVYDFGDRGLMPPAQNAKLSVVTTTAAVTDVDVIGEFTPEGSADDA